MDILWNITSGISLLSSTNHRVININNLHNFMLSILMNAEDEEKEEIIQLIKLHMGLTYYEQFKAYCTRKLKYHDPIIKLLNCS